MELWKSQQNLTFVHDPRYVQLPLQPSAQDPEYCQRVEESFAAALGGAPQWVGRPDKGGSRPWSYFTIKQKSLIHSVEDPLIKVCPIISHSRHPLRTALCKLSRALALLVVDARKSVMDAHSSHLPMWQLHSGSAEWLQRIGCTSSWWGLLEYDVADCFLNTPREAVLAAVDFWLARTQGRTRRKPEFAISKDGKAGDHRGHPSSVHYWVITSKELLDACRWDLNSNSDFEATNEDGDTVVLGQRKGLPIGGHLSAAYVELVALQRELQCQWPSTLHGLPTSRYRDNFFVVVPVEWDSEQTRLLAVALTDLLLMPVQFERGGRLARCLELRLEWRDGYSVKATLAFRTDSDRQGESGDVRTWPEWRDPRTPGLLHGLLAGLASKVVKYSAKEVGGLPASIRGALRFLSGRGYPKKRWFRPFGLELVRLGIPAACLPKGLRRVLGRLGANMDVDQN